MELSIKTRHEDEDNRKLRDKVKKLEAEVEFLKNVSAYFASGHGKIMRQRKSGLRPVQRCHYNLSFRNKKDRLNIAYL